MRPAVVRGKRTMTRGRTSNYTVTMSTGRAAKPLVRSPGDGGPKFKPLTPASFLTRGACAGRATSPTTDWWFAPENERWTTPDGKTHQEALTTREDAQIAKAICHGCPVKNQCLQWSLDNKELYGIYGGLDEQQRREMMGFRW